MSRKDVTIRDITRDFLTDIWDNPPSPGEPNSNLIKESAGGAKLPSLPRSMDAMRREEVQNFLGDGSRFLDFLKRMIVDLFENEWHPEGFEDILDYTESEKIRAIKEIISRMNPEQWYTYAESRAPEFADMEASLAANLQAEVPAWLDAVFNLAVQESSREGRIALDWSKGRERIGQAGLSPGTRGALPDESWKEKIGRWMS